MLEVEHMTVAVETLRSAGSPALQVGKDPAIERIATKRSQHNEEAIPSDESKRLTTAVRNTMPA
ncbi:hypothetical protein [Burkholderia latens]|uniref:hypothetical protein n=1 Tax=Burkholderia latens TaxID=488446 RepID=UPI00158EEF9C|nr:hypothetical protein [Burkholderia latens]